MRLIFLGLMTLLLALSSNAWSEVTDRVVVIEGRFEMMRINEIGPSGGSTGITPFQKVELLYSYDNPVVVCNHVLPEVYNSTNNPNNPNNPYSNSDKDLAVIRLTSANSDSFKIAAQHHDSNGSIAQTSAQCLVAESGQSTLTDTLTSNTYTMVAGTIEVDHGNIAASNQIRPNDNLENRANDKGDISTKTSALNSNGILLSQVMTYNTVDQFFTAWNHRCESRTQAAFNDNSCVSMHTARNDIPDSADYTKEEIGFIAIDLVDGSGKSETGARFATLRFGAGNNVGVGEISRDTNYSRTFDGNHSQTSFDIAVGDQLSMNGADMSWLVQHNIDPALGAGSFRYAIDDANRIHVGEPLSAFAAYQERVDLQISKTVSNATPQIGERVSFSLNVTNAGPDMAESVTVTDVLPAGLSYVTGTIAGGSSASVEGNKLSWTIEAINNDASVGVSFDATVDGPSM